MIRRRHQQNLLKISFIRSYITSELSQDRGQILLRQEQLIERLGFDPATTPTKQDMAVAFKRELSKIMTETAAMIHESREHSLASAVSQSSSSDSSSPLKESSWIRLAEERQIRDHDQSLGRKTLRQKIIDELIKAKYSSSSLMSDASNEKSSILFSDAELIMKIRDDQVTKLISAYRSLNNSRYSFLYDSQLDVTPEVMMGYKRSDESFANFDSRRQEFHFAKREAKQLSDFTDAYKLSTGLTEGDLEDASEEFLAAARTKSGGSTADDFVAAQATAAMAHDNIKGAHVQFSLRLSFLEAFTGCSKEISYKRRSTCRFCKGVGKRRSKCQRCPQCAGRGQLQLPSGSALIEKDCSLCLGSGSTLPPDCSACRGTGLGSVENFRQVIQVPAGAAEGQVIKIRGKGHAGARGGDDGHCFVTLIVQPHRFFHRDESDLHVIVPVQLSVILAGGNISVPALDDEGVSKTISVHVENSRVTRNFNNFETERDEEKQEEKSTSLPMMNDRLIILPEYGMWREGPVSPDGVVTVEEKIRGSLYVHCVGVTPKFDELSKTQRAVLLDHFGGMDQFSKQRDEKYYGNKNEEEKEENTKDHHQQKSYNEAEFAFAKEMCKHWLP
jgi:DnaJ-class molecular chaperone